jgi:hypothetical protein
MDNFDLKKYLVENKATTNSRMLSEGTESTDDVKLVEYGIRPKEVESYKKLGFKIDEQPNNVRIATMSFKGYDWMAVFAVLEDCERMGLRPGMEYEGRNYTFERAYQIADEKAGDTYGEGKGSSDSKRMKEEEDPNSNSDKYYDGKSELPVGTILKGRGHYIVILGHDGEYYEREVVGGKGYGGKGRVHKDSLKAFPIMQLGASETSI